MPTISQLMGLLWLMCLPTWAFIYIGLPWLRVHHIKSLLNAREACARAGIAARDISFRLQGVGKNQFGFKVYRYDYSVKSKLPDGVYLWESGLQFLDLDDVSSERDAFQGWMESIAKNRSKKAP